MKIVIDIPKEHYEHIQNLPHYKTNYEQDLIIDGTPQPNVKQTDGEWIAVIDEIDSLGNKTWHYECSICGNSDSGWGDYKYCPNCGARMKEVE